MIELAVQEVSKTYNPGLLKKKIQAVRNLSFEVANGEVLGLIGPNGAGKSTTIRLLLGLTRPDQGNILFRGQPVSEVPLQGHIGYLPENPYLYDHLSLDELLRFCGRASGLETAQTQRNGEILLEKLDLRGSRKRPLRTFSKGMLQRAGICFALLHDPPMIILDEPMSGLDPIGRKMVFDLVMELKERGKTIFFCSHILSDVERLCDRIGLMNQGSLVRQFGPEDYLEGEGLAIHLLVPLLGAVQMEALKPLAGNIRRKGEGHLLAVSTSNFFQLGVRLEELGVPVLGSQSEWISLEELFMDTILEERP